MTDVWWYYSSCLLFNKYTYSLNKSDTNVAIYYFCLHNISLSHLSLTWKNSWNKEDNSMVNYWKDDCSNLLFSYLPTFTYYSITYIRPFVIMTRPHISPLLYSRNSRKGLILFIFLYCDTINSSVGSWYLTSSHLTDHSSASRDNVYSHKR